MSGAGDRLHHVTEDSIRDLVDAFYVKVRADAEIGPVFARVIPGNDWQPHLDKMYAFWSSVMLTSGRYKGNPVIKHTMITGVRPEMFARWLTLFGETCGEKFSDDVCMEFRIRAERIAESLKIAMFYRIDRPWPTEAIS
jgi:hemoglobin